ncbi:hypothetical protein [Microvirga sp. VF16]|uniref:hypothetical protein n=1 Tax=Microvirga sp. VF16 TaxID=2807101 RepID=UPI001FEFB93E|nr:hypothetical protein [Microvirga sp. VF16]
MKAPRLLVGCKLHGDEMQDTGPDDLVDQSMTFTDRQGCAGVGDFAGPDLEQRVSVGDRDVGLVGSVALTLAG